MDDIRQCGYRFNATGNVLIGCNNTDRFRLGLGCTRGEDQDGDC
jgi:hypothetical protein